MEAFEQVGNLDDLAEAISVQQQAIRLIPNGHADKPEYLNDVASKTQAISLIFRKLSHSGSKRFSSLPVAT